MYSKEIFHAVPRLYQYAQNAVRLTARTGCYAFGYFFLYHARTAWDQILIVQHFEEYLPDYKNLDELKEHYQRGGLGDVKVKKFLNNVLQEELEPIRKRREELKKDITYVYEVLKKGSEVARETAAQTLHEVRDAMKINYFDDMELIRSQAKKYE